MNTKEAMQCQEAIITSAKEWIDGNSSIGSLEELRVLADYYNIHLPASVTGFIYSDNPNHVQATKAHKTILKILENLKQAIISQDNQIL